MTVQRLLRLVLGPAAILGFAVVAPRPATADIFMKTMPDGTLSFSDKHEAGAKLMMKTKAGAKTAAQYSPRPFGGGGADRYTRYDDIIRDAAGYYQLPEAFVRAIIKVESDFDPTALSVAGAQGLTQLMPETGARMLVTDPWDPRENVFGGCRYLRVLANTFNGDLDLTIAAYNAGEGAVIRSGGIPNIAETQDYVVKVKSWYRRYRASSDPMEASVGGSGAD
jgi:soluble lytic murein transglycosylase-like protein